MSGRSTSTNLAVFNKYCISCFEKGNQIDAIYTDFAKAFDRVPHNLLLLKLSKIGFHSQMLSWFRYYLIGRYSVVSVDGFCSALYIPITGIPQGSIIGPLLFILYINDISNCFHNSKYLLYADDLKIYKEISSPNNISDLSKDLQRVVRWSEYNGLPFNTNKCYVMTYHRCRHVLLSKYSINGVILSSIDEILDLGVVCDTKLTFCSHLNYIITKAWSVFGFIRRLSDKSFDHYTRKILFVSFVRSKLEYASVIWNPSALVHSNRIERIQIKFIKYDLAFLNFTNFPAATYSGKCALLSLKTLEARRKIASLNFLYNIVSGNIDCSDLLQSIKILVPQRFLRSRNIFFFILICIEITLH